MEELKEQIVKLRLELQKSENNSLIAARYGKQLLEENSELKNRLAEKSNIDNKQYEVKLETVEQEKHKLKVQVEFLQCQEQSLKEEMEFISGRYKRIVKELEESQEKLQKCTSVNKDLEQDLNLMKIQLTEAKKQILDLQAETSKLSLQAPSIKPENEDHINRQIAQLQEQIQELAAEKEKLLDDLNTKENVTQVQEQELHKKTNEAATLHHELKEIECQVDCYKDALEICRQEITALKLNMNVHQTTDVDLNKRGNSLFSEVEDHRQKLEKCLKQIRDKYKTALKREEEKSQLIRNLKFQMTALAVESSRKVNRTYVQQLEFDLERAHAEIRELHFKNDTLNEAAKLHKGCSSSNIASELPSGGQYEYLKVMLDQARSKIAELESEKKTIWLQYANKRDDARQYRKTLNSKDMEIQHLKAEIMKIITEKEELEQQHYVQIEPSVTIKRTPEQASAPAVDPSLKTDPQQSHLKGEERMALTLQNQSSSLKRKEKRSSSSAAKQILAVQATLPDISKQQPTIQVIEHKNACVQQ